MSQPRTPSPLPSLSRTKITTPRLLLRPLTRHDLPAYHGLRASPAVMKFSPTHVPDDDAAATWAKLELLVWRGGLGNVDGGGEGDDGGVKSYMFGIELRERPGVLVGDVGVVAFGWAPSRGQGRWEGEVGYMLAEELWGKGYMTEAVSAFQDRFWSDVAAATVSESGSTDASEEPPGKDSKGTVVLKAITEEDNVGSYMVLVKNGFKEAKRFVNPGNGDRLVEMLLEEPGTS